MHDKKNMSNSNKQQKNPGLFALRVNINLNLELAKKGNEYIPSKAQLLQLAEEKLSGNRKAAMKLLDNRNSWNSSSTKKTNETTTAASRNILNLHRNSNTNDNVVIASITTTGNPPASSGSSNARRMKTEGNEGMFDGFNE